MTDDRSLERAARSWIEVGPTQAPDRAVEAALLRIETTPQERDLRIPWRLPKMTTPARVAAAAVVGVLAIGGAMFTLGSSGLPTIGGPSPSPRPTLAPKTMQTFRADHDAICAAARRDIEPLIDQLAGIYDAATTPVERMRKADLLAEIGVRTGEYTDELEALHAPTQLAEEHVAEVAGHRAVRDLIAQTVGLLRSGKIAEAQVSDNTTNSQSRQIRAIEERWGMHSCP
jgi:hypothetical protein